MRIWFWRFGRAPRGRSIGPLRETHMLSREAELKSSPSEMSSRTLRTRRAIPRKSGFTWTDDAFAEEMHIHIFGFLELTGLGKVAAVSKSWAACARTESLWQALCDRTWAGKHIHEAQRIKEPQSSLTAMTQSSDVIVPSFRLALQKSLIAAKQRCISARVLCALEWSFRFKRSSGWHDNDPYWNEEAARTVKFEPDGTLSWGDGIPGFRWSFAVTQAPLMAVGASYEASYHGDEATAVRISHVAMGSFPHLRIMRHPTHWGYVLNGPWTIMASFPLLRASDDRFVSDRSLARHVTGAQWAEAEAYNEQDSESDNSDDDDSDED